MAEDIQDRRHSARTRDLQPLEHAVAQILAQTDRPVEVYEATLRAIGQALRWELGAVWELDPHDGRLHCVRTWRGRGRTAAFEALSERLVLAPGEGLPGRVLASGEPAWIADVPGDPNFPRAAAARRGGLHAALGFPLRSPRGVVGVMEFFSGAPEGPDEQLMATLTMLGSQVGQFVSRRRAEEQVRASESRLRAMLDAALDAVVTMDAEGCVTGWNAAAESIFGYSAAEAIGREMAELIVPPALRAAHRRGLARFVATGRHVMLDRRLEVTGIRRDGIEFPVELTITRIGLSEPPAFTGVLRDITARAQADHELRASRARLVAVADAERRRIQRNLHDGAQQRLTSALLSLGRVRAASDDDAALLERGVEELATGLQEIRELAGGLHPSMLTERGLVAALEALALRAPVPVELQASADRRLSDPVEAAAYYVVAEALANVHKHAGARRVQVTVTADARRLVVAVVDDGVGGADTHGAGLRGLADRIQALDGRLTVESPPGGGTRLHAEIPHT
jgi:PAS domain S-box-containing protein